MKNVVKTLLCLVVLLAFTVSTMDMVFAEKSPQKTCPVRGGAIIKDVYTDYKGKRIYFCCPPCISAFKKDPEKYMKKLEEEGVEPEQAPGPKK